MKTASTSVDSAAQYPVAIICAFEREAAVIAERMQSVRRTHYGLFPGFVGTLSGFGTAIAVTGSGENAAYTAVRQLAFLLKPALVAGFGIASAVAEWLNVGEVVLVSQGSRFYCPVALADNMFVSDALIFPTEEARAQIFDAPAAIADPRCLEAALGSLNGGPLRGLLQSRVCSVRVGSSDAPLLAWRAREYVRTRYDVDVADTDSYGLLCAAADVGVPALSMRVIGDSCVDRSHEEFRRKAPHVLKSAAECLETAVAAALACGVER
jgi:nucleoside phosphorylase